jgi:hypothetical protein
VAADQGHGAEGRIRWPTSDATGRGMIAETAALTTYAKPNTYEDSLCQETNYSLERFFAVFSAFRVWACSASGVMF